jgi:Zn-dependent peptidase ImmA (M78 family)
VVVARSEAAARALLAEHPQQTPVDPAVLVKELGLVMVEQDLADDVSGVLIRREGQTVLGVNAQHPPERRRFAAAHLLGHVRLHKARQVLVDTAARVTLSPTYAGLPTDREEAEANRFAAGLLMPDPALREAVLQAGETPPSMLVERLSAEFGVTTAVMSYRLIAAGYILDAA